MENIINSTNFAFDFYRNLFDQNENTISSPFSLRIALSILYQSSHDVVESEIRNKLYFGNKKEIYSIQKEHMRSLLVNPSLKLANKFYIKSNGILNKNIERIIYDYKSHIEEVDFLNNFELSKMMNEWIDDETEGFIKEITTPDSIAYETQLFIVNAFRFKSTWLKPFDRRSVYKETFHGINNQGCEIEMMSQYTNFRTGKLYEIKSQIIEIPYENQTNLVFWIILPDETSSLSHVKDLLSYEIMLKINETIKPDQVHIKLPLFEIVSNTNIKQVMKQMGILAMFEEKGIQILNNLLMKVDGIKQKSKIIVNTDGTQASTGNYIRAIPLNTWRYFRANRPFIYIILSANTLEPIHIGHFSNPLRYIKVFY